MPVWRERTLTLPRLSEWPAITLPEVTVQDAGSMPILSLTADEIRWVQPR
jgi:hypothetical protein